MLAVSPGGGWRPPRLVLMSKSVHVQYHFHVGVQTRLILFVRKVGSFEV